MPPPRLIDKNPAHQCGRDIKEIPATRQRGAANVHQPEIDLMDEGRRLYGDDRRFSAELPARDTSQLVIDKRHQAVEGPFVSLAPGSE